MEEEAAAAEVEESLVRAQLPSGGYCNSLSVRVLLLLLEEPGCEGGSPCTMEGKLTATWFNF